jgi:hypothetical protein
MPLFTYALSPQPQQSTRSQAQNGRQQQEEAVASKGKAWHEYQGGKYDAISISNRQPITYIYI